TIAVTINRHVSAPITIMPLRRELIRTLPFIVTSLHRPPRTHIANHAPTRPRPIQRQERLPCHPDGHRPPAGQNSPPQSTASTTAPAFRRVQPSTRIQREKQTRRSAPALASPTLVA